MDAVTSTTRPARNSARPLIAALAAAFLAGGALVGYGVYRYAAPATAAPAPVAAQGAVLGESRALASPTPSATASETVKAVAEVRQQQRGLDQRIPALEQRIAQLDLQAQAVAGNTARAEGLLIAFAARRTLEKGGELGYLGDQLRLRFGDALPNAVTTVLGMSQRPVTLDQLIARLDGLAPELAAPTHLSALERFRAELADLFVIRRESAPSPQPQRRLERARMFLESGRADAAIAEIENLPGAVEAKDWIADAHRYAEAQKALDLIETAAVLEPRKLRDSAGDTVEQPGMAAPAP